MKLQNLTRVPAMLYRGVVGKVDENRMFGSMFARVTYSIAGQELVVSDEQLWEVSAPPWDGPHGKMESDEVFYRGGVDLLLFGSARAPGGQPVQWLEVEFRVGANFSHRIWAFGNRVWERKGGDLVQSDPEYFTEIPLTLENAFGGTDEWDKLPMPFVDNPEGKGYYLDEQKAEGSPLPNLEHPDQRIARWDDRPEPVGTRMTEFHFGPRLRRGTEFDNQTGAMKTLYPCFFNSAFPDMVVPAAAPGDEVTVTNVLETGPLTFRIPESPLKARLRFGDERIERDLVVDQIGIEPDAGQVFIAWRHPFRYRLNPLQERECILEPAHDSVALRD